MNFGTSFQEVPLGKLIFLVDMWTKSPTTNGHMHLCLFACTVCLTLAVNNASCAVVNASFILCTYAFTLGYSSLLGASQIIALGIHPVFRKNGEYPVDSDRARLIANSIAGNLKTQSFWVSPIQDRNICPIV